MAMLASFVLGSTGCGGGGDADPCAGLLPGDLALSEIMANPSGADGDREWVEIWNASAGPLSLDGIEIVRAGLDGAGPRAHTLATPDVLEAGAYYVVGGVIDQLRPSYVDYGVGNDLGDFGNTGGVVQLRCGDRVLDEVTYVDTTDGASWMYDGELAPSSTGNDDATRWCDAATAFSTGDFGSPGLPNPPCGSTSPTTCRSGDTTRDIVAPGVGDVVITEIMPNPNAVLDSAGEWFEVLITADVDLNGLQLGKEAGTVLETITAVDCISVTAGTRLVFGANMDMATNGGLPRVDYIADLGLANGGGSLFVGHGGAVLDVFAYSDSSAGASTQLDPRHLTPSGNDDETHWCASTMTYGGGDAGTPGSANEMCDIPLPPGMCDDAGTLRATVPPALGDVIITEIMPNPTGLDTELEWFEVYFASDADLRGLELGTAPGVVDHRYSGPECLRITAGTYVVFAKNGMMSANGGLPAEAIDYDSLALGNRPSSNAPGALYVGLGGATLDVANYFAAPLGVAQSLDSAALDASLNEMEANWCDADASDTYGSGDRGTPGAANPACPLVVPDGMCLDGETIRAVVSPTLGQVIITEVMSNPAAVGDTEGEWIELYVTADVDLNGLQVGRADVAPSDTLSQPECLRVTAGTHVVIARNDTMSANGGLPPETLGASFSLTSTSGASVGIADAVLDVVRWTSETEGESQQLDKDEYDASTNDDFDAVACAPRTSYGSGDLGTPGATNTDCLGVGECWEGDVARSIVSPVVGDLYINEVMPNPATSEGAHEWFEVFVVNDVDLNDVTVSDHDSSYDLTNENCLAVTSGSYLVFARSTEPAMNGELPGVDFLTTTTISMLNTGGSLSLALGATPLDAISWTTTQDGYSRTLRPGQGDPPADNDNEANWCDATTPYGTASNGNFGSPGEANTCP